VNYIFTKRQKVQVLDVFSTFQKQLSPTCKQSKCWFSL